MPHGDLDAHLYSVTNELRAFRQLRGQGYNPQKSGGRVKIGVKERQIRQPQIPVRKGTPELLGEKGAFQVDAQNFGPSPFQARGENNVFDGAFHGFRRIAGNSGKKAGDAEGGVFRGQAD